MIEDEADKLWSDKIKEGIALGIAYQVATLVAEQLTPMLMKELIKHIDHLLEKDLVEFKLKMKPTKQNDGGNSADTVAGRRRDEQQ